MHQSAVRPLGAVHSDRDCPACFASLVSYSTLAAEFGAAHRTSHSRGAHTCCDAHATAPSHSEQRRKLGASSARISAKKSPPQAQAIFTPRALRTRESHPLSHVWWRQ